MIKFLMTKHRSSHYLLAASILTTSSFIVALDLSFTTKIIAAAVLLMSFLVANSVARGLFAIFSGLALTTLIGALSLPGKSFDTPNFVFLFTCSGALLTHFLMRRVLRTALEESRLLELAASISLFATSFALRPITHSKTADLLGNLGPEDNAAWIHAASGFVRFNATASDVSAMQYGSSGFLSVLLSFLSSLTKWNSNSDEIRTLLATVFNTYIAAILLVGFFTIMVSGQLYTYFRQRFSLPLDVFTIFALTLTSVPSFIITGLLMATYGHLSLVCLIMCIWLLFWTLIEFRILSAGEKQHIPNQKTQSFMTFTISIVTASVWFPIIPAVISALCFYVILIFQDIRKAKKMKVGQITTDFLFARNVFTIFLFVLMLPFASYRLMSFPSGYSASDLINAQGGVAEVTAITLALAIIGIVIFAELIYKIKFLSFLILVIPLELLGVWVLTLNESPKFPQYSVQKFTVLVTAIGVPIFIGLLITTTLVKISSPLLKIVAPALLVFASLQLTYGINSFPRYAVMATAAEPVWNYQEDLIHLAKSHKNSHLLCLSNEPNLDIYAYFCSRFGSALQFKERGDGEFARRWRSSILKGSVDSAEILEVGDFRVLEKLNQLLLNGGSLVVDVIPGPFSKVLTRADNEWVKQLPWDQIETYWQK